ncbi:Two component system, signal transduction histidine kinase [Acididesulfobacillus acetoxydans]|uniref:histidine kinase n=1 Tax=Acididesulfobacillus acetoxydans TaxID=1561005 RepID=A0A8S0Y315_9FIRM|nr:ATP-binding protein [Acididesulfobacillus acetoxydans]CAA7601465.1 Two component system, signal transduction histidine kinase [Acididesulfobacillus acetoxydans]CEJ06120.1 Oxygen sensor histidine kinase NreB [Acididesulfobacillus acetoxydans]
MTGRVMGTLRRIVKFLFNLVGLRFKVMGIILLVVLIFGGIAIWQVRQSAVATFRRQLDSQGISAAQDVAASSVDYIYTNNVFGLYQLVEETLKYNKDVRYVFILSPNGRVLISSFGQGVPVRLLTANRVDPSARDHLQLLRTEDGLIHDIAVPADEGRAGTVRLGLSEKTLWSTVGGLIHRLLLTVLVAAGLGLLAAWVLTVLLSRPILALVRAARSIGEGNLECRVSLDWAQDEIGQLGLTFNQMMDSLQDYHQKVRAFSRELLERNQELQRVSEELKRKEEMRSYLLGRLITAQEEERHRIARELHDQTSQSLTSLMVGLKNAEAAPDMAAVRRNIAGLRAQTDGILEEVHNLALELRPRVLDDLGLPAGLQRYCRESAERYALDIDLHLDGFAEGERLSPELENTLFRVIQEGITNAAKHARAKNVSVILERREKRILAIVEDDGCGFEPERLKTAASAERKLGLFGMQERMALVEGHMTIESEPGEGTTLYFDVPLPESEGGKQSGEDPDLVGG